MKAVLKSLILLLALAAPTVVHSQCAFCPGGIENPGAQVQGVVPCDQADAYFGTVEDNNCLAFQIMVSAGCCPSYLSNFLTDNSCGWCPNGVTNTDGVFTIPGGVGSFTCVEVLQLVAARTGDQDDGICGLAAGAAPVCCPGDSTGGGPPACEFCPLGVENAGDVLPIDIPGLSGSGLTCADFSAGAQFITNATECMDVKQLEGLCCPETTNNYQCPWCTLGIENPDTLFPVIDITCESLGTLVKAASDDEMCSQYQQAQSICCPTSVGAEPCDFCTGPLGVEFPNKAIDDDSGTTCSDLAIFALGPPSPDFCMIVGAAQGLCCPGSTGVSLPPVAEGDYCYICGNAQTEMTKPDVQPFNMLGDAEDPEDLMTCAEIEKAINDERGAGESCASALSAFTVFLSPSICGCAGIEPPDACKFCEGKSIKRDVKLPEESFTCGQGYDFIKHFVSDFSCDAPNTSIDDAQKICCGEPTQAPVQAPTQSAASTVTGIFVMLVSLLATFALW